MTKFTENYRIKLFADGADLATIRDLNSNPLVSGFTTNPTLMRKAGVVDYLEFAKNVIDEVGPKPISLEVFADDTESMREQALRISKLGSNVYVKIPITTTRGEPTSKLTKELSQDGVSLNITAIFTRKQVEDTVEALVGGAPSVVSVFAGRIADCGIDPVPLMTDFSKLTSTHPEIELLWASPREILNLVQAEHCGADIITMTSDLWAKINGLGKSLETFSLETVEMFYMDAVATKYSL
jgi:transaldolase